MQVGIIGVGARALALARLLAGSGIEVVISGDAADASMDSLQRDFSGAVRSGGVMGAAEPEIVMLAMPWTAIAETVRPIVDWGARTVIDATNRDEESGDATPSTILVSELLPEARVVKAFNTLPGTVLEAGPGSPGGRLVIFYSGDHKRSKDQVARLIQQVGFCPIDLGTLAQSAALQEPGGALFGLRLSRLA